LDNERTVKYVRLKAKTVIVYYLGLPSNARTLWVVDYLAAKSGE
jgi:hypothetical protein